MLSFLRGGKHIEKLTAQVEAAVVERVGADFEVFLNDVAAPAFNDKFLRLLNLGKGGGEGAADAYQTFRTEIVDLRGAILTFAEERIRTAIEGMEVIGKDNQFRRHLSEAVTTLANGTLESGAKALGVPFEPFV